MKIYAVGGAIRDQLLGLPSVDTDYVVVGATPEEMIRQGFKPVGSDFPVFIHPQSQAEYALARTERKTGKGYKGFTFHADPKVTLEEDLSRRDLTINAMAQEIDANGQHVGPVIDPYGGQADLRHRVFRHVGPAFVEDPLRVLRVARFAARFDDFGVHPQTQDLLIKMVAAGELKDLVAERIWQEISRGLMEKKPSKMFEVLQSCQALKEVFPKDFQEPSVYQQTLRDLDVVARAHLPMKLRFAALMSHVNDEQARDWYEWRKIPSEERTYAELFRIWRDGYVTLDPLDPEKIMQFFDRADIWRKPNRFDDLMDLADSLGFKTERWRVLKNAAYKVDAGEVAQKLKDQAGEEIKKQVHLARLKAVESCL